MSSRRPTLLPLIISLALVMLSWINQSAADELPEHSATYTLTKGPLALGEMTRTLSRQADGSYLFETQSKPIGIARWFTSNTLTESSHWFYHKGEMRPIEYIYDRKGSKKRLVKLNFDWQKQRVTNTVNNDPWSMPITENTVDKLLYQLAVIYDLERGKKEFHYQVADGGSLKQYEFIPVGRETIETTLGKLDTVKLKRPGRRATVIWCAPNYHHIPVRIEQNNDDEGLLRMDITKLTGIKQTRAPSHLTTPR